MAYRSRMSDNLRTFTKATYGFEHVLRLTSEKALARKAPCDGWKGTDVVEHVMGALAMVNSYATTGNGPKKTPKVGADALASWSKLRDATLATLDSEGALQRIANDPFGPEFGPMPIDALIGFMAADMVPHIWDLARTAKVDERLDPTLVKHATAMWKSLPDQVLRMPGMMGPAVKPAKGADAQTKLLNLLGRTV
jgi:uncharacterized protein (TIGR03086 family)